MGGVAWVLVDVHAHLSEMWLVFLLFRPNKPVCSDKMGEMRWV